MDWIANRIKEDAKQRRIFSTAETDLSISNVDPIKEAIKRDINARSRSNTPVALSSALDVGQIRSEYQMFLNDDTIDNPFALDSRLVRIIREHTSGLRTDLEKARAIYDWIEDNIHYGDSRRETGYANSLEVLENRQGICGEMAFLYVTMARSIGLKANYVSVDVDCYGEDEDHACAIVYVNGKGLLVDPAYNMFGAKHQEYEVQTDAEVLDKYLLWRL